MMILLVHTATVQPFELAFYNSDEINFNLEVVIEALFLLDILHIFMSAYVDRDRKLETRLKVIAINYIKSWFFLDLIACIPF